MLTVAQEQTSQGFNIPAPIKGIDTRQVLSRMDPETTISMINIMPEEEGCAFRAGTLEYGNGSTGDNPYTLLPFNGLAEDGTEDLLFLCDQDGIWDVTTSGDTSPTKVFSWATTTAGAGICSYIQTIDTNGAAYVLLCDKLNGYHVYTVSTSTWAAVAQGAGATQVASPADPTKFAYVMKWKERVWFIQEDTQTAWYMDVLALYGTATKFEFGNKHPHGGFLNTLSEFTRDGGDGADDMLVSVSTGGDISLWTATDPDNDMQMVGRWFVGETPTVGRRGSIEYGGDVYVLSVRGITSMSALIEGKTLTNERNLLTDKIGPFIRSVMTQGRATFGWGLVIDASRGTLIITTPDFPSYDSLQFVLNLTTDAWAIWQDMPIEHGVMFRDNFYVCKTVDSANRVYKLTGFVDDVRISGSPDPLGINWSVMGAYTDGGVPVANKQVHFLRPVFTQGSYPSYVIEAKYDFDVSGITFTPVIGNTNVALWGSALWSSALWAGAGASAETPSGGAGMGRHFTYALKGISSSAGKFITTELIANVGGLL